MELLDLQEGKIAVVHNGIIENYLEIKHSLIRKGVVFSSDTDTEVIVQLLEYYYRKKSNLMDAVYAVLNRIKGAYAMGILCSDFPGQMVAARKDAPLLIGYGKDGNYIASDVTALLAHTRTVTYMEDDEVAVITADHVQIYDRDRFLLEKRIRFWTMRKNWVSALGLWDCSISSLSWTKKIMCTLLK